MVWNKLQMKFFGTLCVVVVLMTACSVSYKFNGSSIDYTKVKTIAFETFPNRSAGFVWGPMESMFNTALQDIYLQQTRLQQVKRDGDLQISGEITNYDAYNKGVGADGYSIEYKREYYINAELRIYDKKGFDPAKDQEGSYTGGTYSKTDAKEIAIN